jgi:hypothetical protein
MVVDPSIVEDGSEAEHVRAGVDSFPRICSGDM